MKKQLLILAAAAFAMSLAACSDDKTELRWQNQSGQAASEIKWVPAYGAGDISYSTELTNDGDLTEFKEIPEGSRDGNGECVLGNGLPGDIVYEAGKGPAISLSAGESATYLISDTTASAK